LTRLPSERASAREKKFFATADAVALGGRLKGGHDEVLVV